MNSERTSPVPITVVNGYLGAGKTTIILNMLKHISQRYNVDYENTNSDTPASNSQPTSLAVETEGKQSGGYRVVWLKNEFGVNEVDSVLANQSSISAVKEVLNGCLCCTLVGKLSIAIEEILTSIPCDRIVIETSGSAYPAPLAQEINRCSKGEEGAPKLNIMLDGVVCVIDAVNFEGYQDTSHTARIQAQYTDLIIMNKYELATQSQFDRVMDSVCDLNAETPIVKAINGFVDPEVVFGLDHRLFSSSLDTLHSHNTEGFRSDVDVLHAEWLTLTRLSSSNSNTCVGNIGGLTTPMTGVEFGAFMDYLSTSVCIRVKGVIMLSQVAHTLVDIADKYLDKCGDTVSGLMLLNWAFGKFTLTLISPAVQVNGVYMLDTAPTQSLKASYLYNTHAHTHTTPASTEIVGVEGAVLVHSRLTMMGVALGAMVPFQLQKVLPVKVRGKSHTQCNQHCSHSLSEVNRNDDVNSVVNQVVNGEMLRGILCKVDNSHTHDK